MTTIQELDNKVINLQNSLLRLQTELYQCSSSAKSLQNSLRQNSVDGRLSLTDDKRGAGSSIDRAADS